MLDVSVAYKRFKFLGCEFLTWLWFVIDQDQDRVRSLEPEPVSLGIGNRIVLENRRQAGIESITIKGDDAGLEEGLLALRKGAVVTEMNLLLKIQEQQWRFTVKGESLHLIGLRTPPTGTVESGEDLEGAVLEKAYLCDRAIQCMDKLFKQFILLRLSEDWSRKVVSRMRQWIHS